MDLSTLLQGPIGNQLMSSVTQKLGVSENQAQSAIAMALPLLLTALNKNANNGDAQGIANALEKHNGSIFDNFSGFLNGGVNTQDSLGILGHIFGNKQQTVETAVEKSSGLNATQVMSVLVILAPIVMNYLGKQKQANNLDANGVAGLLGSLVNGGAAASNSNLSTFERLLDQNGDGNIKDDLVNLGSKFLGGLFK
ncbi:DUF937 domain-containing protein [Vaginella massiliensis]|uniref:DUF937 domain-containing protein n=1 Tax=Vaginella massiliensis TaxID=1816680 RepID=UPI0037534681